MCHHNTLRVVEADVPTRIQRMHVDRVEGKVLYGRGYDDDNDVQYPTTLEMHTLEHGVQKNDEIIVQWFGMQRVVSIYYNKQKARDMQARGEKLEGKNPQEVAERLIAKHGTLETAARKENIGEGTLHAMRKGKPGAGRRLIQSRSIAHAKSEIRKVITQRGQTTKEFADRHDIPMMCLVQPNPFPKEVAQTLVKAKIDVPKFAIAHA